MGIRVEVSKLIDADMLIEIEADAEMQQEDNNIQIYNSGKNKIYERVL